MIMTKPIGIEARLALALFSGQCREGIFEEPAVPYGPVDELDLLSARELFALLGRVRSLLESKGFELEEQPISPTNPQVPAVLHIDKDYHIFIETSESKSRSESESKPLLKEVVLQPILKTVFILFLKHPEGVSVKERTAYISELDAIYARICPNLDPDVRSRRIERLVSPYDNSFSEKLSNLNKRLESILDKLMGPGRAVPYQVRGQNGHPRRIHLDPLYIHWA